MDASDRICRMGSADLHSMALGVWKDVFRQAGLHSVPLPKLLRAEVRELEEDYAFVHAIVIGKMHPVLFRKRKEYRHGILQHAWQPLIEAAAAKKQRFCYVCLFECFRTEEDSVWSGRLLLQNVKNLGKPLPPIPNTELTDSWLFPRDRFAVIGRISATVALKNTRKLPKTASVLRRTVHKLSARVGLGLFER